MKPLLNFISYHNAIPIFFGILFLGSGVTFAASPEARELVFKSETTVASVDNLYLLDVDIASYPFTVQVTAVTEDDTQYFVEYTFATIDLVDGVWRDSTKTNTLKVTKEVLNGRDLGLYVTEQLTQLRIAERVRLLETQALERSIGQTHKIVATMYSGLVGRMLDSSNQVFDGYIPVTNEINTSDLDNDLDGGLSEINDDTTPPAITIIGENPMRIFLNSTFTDPGVVITGEDLAQITTVRILDSVEVSTFDNLDTARVNSYVLTYRITDAAGNTSEVRREVVVDGNAGFSPPPSQDINMIATSSSATSTTTSAATSSPADTDGDTSPTVE